MFATLLARMQSVRYTACVYKYELSNSGTFLSSGRTLVYSSLCSETPYEMLTVRRAVPYRGHGDAIIVADPAKKDTAAV